MHNTTNHTEKSRRLHKQYLLYVAWGNQRHRQFCICHTEQFLNGTVLYDGWQGVGGRTFKVWRTHQRVRQPREPQDACFNPLTSVKIGQSILTLATCDLSRVDSLRLLPGAFESPTSTVIVRKLSCTGYNGTHGGSR